MTKTTLGAPRRRNCKCSRHHYTRKSVLKMLTVMSEETDATRDFLTTGRAGRRNALADIMSDHALTSTSDLPDKLMKCLSTTDSPSSTDGGNFSGPTEEENKKSEEVATSSPES